MALRCISCEKTYSQDTRSYTCPECSGLLEVCIDLDEVRLTKGMLEQRSFTLWRYRELMPVMDASRAVSLREGGTPLYRAPEIAEYAGVREVYIKNEGANPTGSFKDRGMTVGVTKALEFGARAVGCASTGNTSASLSAYAAKAGIRCLVLLPAGKIALGKLAQAVLHGATVVGIRANFDVALSLIKEACAKYGVYLLNSINPWRLEGQKSCGFEIAEQLGWEVPDRVVVPMGNCGNISAIWKGFREFRSLGLIDELPAMTGIQAEGASPVVEAFRAGRSEIVPVKEPETVATAIRIGAPVNAPKALRAIRESGGCAESVSDAEILEAQRVLARCEGVGVEPASAASVAGLRKLVEMGEVDRSERVVCVTTGHALKDPEIIFSRYEKPLEIEPSILELGKIISSGA
ncbi:MAG: threonine synthase [Euryarchaeota archaeon]|nr:threonine synthase [Euryarchaeota archaeon]